MRGMQAEAGDGWGVSLSQAAARSLADYENQFYSTCTGILSKRIN